MFAFSGFVLDFAEFFHTGCQAQTKMKFDLNKPYAISFSFSVVHTVHIFSQLVCFLTLRFLFSFHQLSQSRL